MNTSTTERDHFKKAILSCLDDLYRFARSLCHDKENAEDLVSETVLKALENKNKLKDTSKLKQWMLRVLSNRFIDEKRRLKRQLKITEKNKPSREMFSLYEKISTSTFTDHATPEVELIQKLSNEKIQIAIKQLPEVFRVAFVLCEVEELSYQQISSTLQLKIGTVRSRIARARSLLQKSLWQQAQETGIKLKTKKDIDCNC